MLQVQARLAKIGLNAQPLRFMCACMREMAASRPGSPATRGWKSRPRSMRKAIVTIAHGEAYLRRWRAYALPTWKRYASRHGYSDIIAFTAPLDLSDRAERRSIAWQELLVTSDPKVQEHEAAVWIDADVVINDRAAPCIVEAQSTGKIGLCEEMQLPDHLLFSQMIASNRSNLIEGCERLGIPHPLDPFRRYGLSERPARHFNTGVVVFRPREHREVFQAVYDGYEDRGFGRLFEQVPFSHELVKREPLRDPRSQVQSASWQVLYRPGMPSGKAGNSRWPRGNSGCPAQQRLFPAFAGIQNVMSDLALLDFRYSPIRLRADKVSARARYELALLM